ncbi:MAG: endonuclease III [Alphaproteobacteria bacterium]|nr:endonuclease III [Alphaproteobacteria bacterium]MCL2890109.1 endonuclease III [Alphaproteobacteria bacterium]
MKLTPNIYFTKVPPALDMSIRSELYYTNEFTFAVAVILSAQATDKKVNEVTPALFEIADTPEKMFALGIDGLREHIKVISFFNNKAKNIIGSSKMLVSPSLRGSVAQRATRGSSPQSAMPTAPLKKGGTGEWFFPTKYHNRDELLKLPGIGQKTANVIMNVLWGAPLIGVDTHVYRNAHRYGWVAESDNTPEKVEVKLLQIIPKKYHGIVNHVMVLHGRYICKALRPLCDQCPVAKYCPVRK